MPKIVYYVASSLDGYIEGPNQDISGFAFQGEGVKQYQKDLQDFSVTLMGRKTYEFGYQYGLEPGQPAYPHMQHHIFSQTLTLDNAHPQVHVEALNIERVKEIRDQAPTDVYLCGGGQFAGWLLENDLIDVLKLKMNPILLGGGTRLFGDSQKAMRIKQVHSQSFPGEFDLLTYELS